MTDTDVCEKCGEHWREYDEPAGLCQLCWHEWWFAGVFAGGGADKVAAEWDEWLEARDATTSRRMELGTAAVTTRQCCLLEVPTQDREAAVRAAKPPAGTVSQRAQRIPEGTRLELVDRHASDLDGPLHVFRLTSGVLVVADRHDLIGLLREA